MNTTKEKIWHDLIFELTVTHLKAVLYSSPALIQIGFYAPQRSSYLNIVAMHTWSSITVINGRGYRCFTVALLSA